MAACAADRCARRVSHHRAPGADGPARRARVAACMRCADRAPRGAAHDLRRSAGRRRADDPRAAALPVARNRS
ncbi:hypothetical protein L810_1227 [Burkholderia sp. AU4i]|nr:hypothetical protein L810_1227 [Burkholderia sp. AU4i]